jgi:putative Mn2+ efflux pump MntP
MSTMRRGTGSRPVGKTFGKPARAFGPRRPAFAFARQKDAMNFAATASLALAMSTDAFAAAVGKGAALQRPHLREALRTGAIFGVIEGLTPLLGWVLGNAAAPYVQAWDHWIAFVLLGALGLRMIHAGWGETEPDEEKPNSHSFLRLAVTGMATSIDALIVGAGLAFIDANIFVTAAAIGCATFVMVTLGVMLGRGLGALVGKRAEIVGGIVLIVIGSVILYEHLHAAAG